MTTSRASHPSRGEDPDWAIYEPDRGRVDRLRLLGLHGAADELERAIELDWRAAQRRRIRQRLGLQVRFGPEEEN